MSANNATTAPSNKRHLDDMMTATNSSTDNNNNHNNVDNSDEEFDVHKDPEFGVPMKKIASTKSAKSIKSNKSAAKPRPHVCSICTRAFARLEHLKRHERSHTNEKPFQCAACGRCFARRDLVLRHQQKLHASLPTNNRTNITRKNKIRHGSGGAGDDDNDNLDENNDIVRDHLNDNINIVRNNTSAKLPLNNNNDTSTSTSTSFKPNLNNLNSTGSEASFRTTSTDHNLHPHQMHHNHSSSISPDSDNNSRNKVNPNPYFNHNFIHDQVSIFNTNLMSTTLTNNAYTSPTSLNNFVFSPNVNKATTASPLQLQHNPSGNHRHSVVNSNITPESLNRTSGSNNNIPTNIMHVDSDELDSDIDSGNEDLKFDIPQAMYSLDQHQQQKHDHERQTQQEQESQNQTSYRNHRHNSFSAAASSSYTGLPDTAHIHDKNMQDLENEAPQQVNFSSPQLTYKPNPESGYLDMDILENLDLNDLGLDLDSFNVTNLHLVRDNKSNEGDSKQNETLSPREVNLQKVLSNPSNGVALQRVLSHPQSGVALQKVLSHPNSDVALQKVLSHPEPNKVLAKVLSSPPDIDWFTEFINAPIETDFPVITDHIGFTDTPENVDSPATAATATHNFNTQNFFYNNSNFSPSSTNDLKHLFRLRQIDLSKHIPHTYQNPTIPGRCSEFARSHIMSKYNLNQQQFPLLDDLNHYLALYEIEFNKYFPFVHIPSFKIDDNLDQIPLLLSMAAVGALYSFHARNSSTLFNFSRFLIHNFMEIQMQSNKFNDIPLHITQALVLHMFLGMFHNDQEITRLIPRQLNSLVSLVKTTKLDMPLESLLLPPNCSIDIVTCDNKELIESCYKYFVLAQSRIRTVHVLHYITVLFGCLTNSKIEMSAEHIESGSPCSNEDLWYCKDYNKWINILKENSIVISSKFSLIRLSNGHSYKELWKSLENLSLNQESIGLRTMFSLLLTMNEYIHNESMKLEQSDKTEGVKLTEWRMEHRPYIENLIKIWESSYIRNRGVLVSRGQNIHTINNSQVLKLTLPLLSFAKINKCVYISSVLSHVWERDWDAMNLEFKHLTRDIEALRDSINYSLDIINLWIEIISINNDAEKTSIRTPIFFLTCLFTATLLISEYLYTTEVWANSYIKKSNNSTELTTADRVLWLRAEKIFKKIEKNLLPIGSNNQSYSEFLRIQANGALDVNILDDEIARLALEPGDQLPIAELIISGRLSTRCLALGVRILADAPVWPLALLFAEALKARAIHIHKCTSLWNQGTPNSATSKST